jgi:Fe-S cluster biosynthesis and repair protein YggX
MITEKMVDRNIVERGVAYFRLGENFGQMITDLVRERAWQECQRDAAILILVDNMDMPVDLARQIIDGKMKLVTNKDKVTVRAVKDKWKHPDFEGMEKEVNTLMNEARSVLYPDMPRGTSGQLRMLTDKEQDEMRVALRDVKEMLKMNIWKALERAKFLIEWIESATNYESRRHVIQRMQIEAGVGDFGPADEEGENEEHDLLADIKADVKARIEEMPLDPEQKERLLRLADSQGKDPDLVEDPTFEHDTGWLDREGHYWGCEMGLHIAFADKLVGKFFPIEGDTSSQRARNAERFLEEEGWMKCTGRVWYETEKPPTPSQKSTLKKWCEKWTISKYHAMDGSYY